MLYYVYKIYEFSKWKKLNENMNYQLFIFPTIVLVT